MSERDYEPFDLESYRAHVQSSPCFICSILAGQDETHHLIYRDDVAIAFLNKYPTLYGYTLVAPVEHREQVTGDFSVDEYVALQRIIYLVAEALREELPTERVYILSLGSQQGNRHVHWHVAALPPGVPYQEQQYAALLPFVTTADTTDRSGKQTIVLENRGYLKIPEDELRNLAARLSRRIASLKDSQT